MDRAGHSNERASERRFGLRLMGSLGKDEHCITYDRLWWPSRGDGGERCASRARSGLAGAALHSAIRVFDVQRPASLAPRGEAAGVVAGDDAQWGLADPAKWRQAVAGEAAASSLGDDRGVGATQAGKRSGVGGSTSGRAGGGAGGALDGLGCGAMVWEMGGNLQCVDPGDQL